MSIRRQFDFGYARGSSEVVSSVAERAAIAFPPARSSASSHQTLTPPRTSLFNAIELNKAAGVSFDVVTADAPRDEHEIRH